MERSKEELERLARGDEQLETFGQVRDLMKRLHDQNVSTSYAAHAVWKVISQNSKHRHADHEKR